MPEILEVAVAAKYFTRITGTERQKVYDRVVARRTFEWEEGYLRGALSTGIALGLLTAVPGLPQPIISLTKHPVI